MAVDMMQKKTDWVNSLLRLGMAFVDSMHDYKAVAESYTSLSYDGGDPNRAGNEITDEDLSIIAPWLDKASLNAFIFGVQSMIDAHDANAGVIEAARP